MNEERDDDENDEEEGEGVIKENRAQAEELELNGFKKSRTQKISENLVD